MSLKKDLKSFKDAQRRQRRAKSVEKPQGKAPLKRGKKRGFSWRAAGRAFLILVMLGIIATTVVLTGVAVYVSQFASNEEIDIRAMKLNYTTIMYYTDESSGEDVELKRISGAENRIWVDYQNMPQNIIDACVAVEDERFWDHQGVDWKRTFGAFVNYFTEKVGMPIYNSLHGGSTITQQLVKMVTNERDVEITRKVKEIVRALILETNFSKEDIVEAYLNMMPVSDNTNGVQAAANLYFGKDVKDLTLAECASLVVITKDPSKYSPFKNPESNRARQLYCLSNMLEMGKITQSEYDEAVAQPMVFRTEDYIAKKGEVNSYFVDTAIEDARAIFMERFGISKDEAWSKLAMGGYRIYTTVDPKIQSAIEEVYESETFFETFNYKKFYDEETKTYTQPQGAMIIMDYKGAIKGVVGGRGVKTESRVQNRATMSTLQPGSTMKPVAVYGPAFEQNLITWSTLVDDAPVGKEMRDGKQVDWPVNYYGEYWGMIPIELAVQRSTNTVPVRIGEILTPKYMYDYVTQRLGYTTLVAAKQIGKQVFSDIGYGPLCLGSTTNGVTVREQVGAFMVFGNGGEYYTPYSITKILDAKGNVVYQADNTPIRALSAETAELMNKLLQRVVAGKVGTGRRAAFGGWTLAGKTGTASDNTAHWWIGLTPYYIGGCWFGFDEPYPITLRTSHPSINAWRAVMQTVHQGLPKKDFPSTGNLVYLPYCTRTGLLATPECGPCGYGWFKPDAIPETCNLDHFREARDAVID